MSRVFVSSVNCTTGRPSFISFLLSPSDACGRANISSNIGDDKDRINLKTQKSTLSADRNITSAFILLNGAFASVIAGDWLLLEGVRAVDMAFVGGSWTLSSPQGTKIGSVTS